MVAEEKAGIQPGVAESGEAFADLTMGDIVKFVRNHALVLFLGIALGLASGLLSWRYIPPLWSAEITLKIGPPPPSTGMVPDQPAELLEKIKSQLFLLDVVHPLTKDEIDAQRYLDLMSRKLKAVRVGGGDMLRFTVPGKSAAQAYAAASEIAKKVIEMQSEQYLPYLGLMQARRKANSEELDTHRKLLSKMQIAEAAAWEKGDADKLLLVMARQGEYAEVIRLQQKNQDLEDMLFSFERARVSLVTRSALSESPASPKLIICLLLGVLGGIVLAAIIVSVRSTFLGRS